jgi:predicted membrane protein
MYVTVQVAIEVSWGCGFWWGFIPIYGCSWCYLLGTSPGDRDISLQLLCYPFLDRLSTFSETKEYHELVKEAIRLLSDVLPGSGLSEQLLKEAHYEIRRQLRRHGYGDEKIDSLCEEINRILAEAAEAQRILSLMRILEALSKLLTLVIMVCIFEFPNNLRPPSTTMPWIIVPALFVLWGVCWMFINHDIHFTIEDNDADELESESVFVSPYSNDTDLLPDAFLSLQHDPLLVERVDSKYSSAWRE